MLLLAQLVAEPARSILLWAMEFMTELVRNQECTGVTKQDAANVSRLSPSRSFVLKSDRPSRYAAPQPPPPPRRFLHRS